MIWLVVVLSLLIVCFGGVLLFGAPFVPTMQAQVNAALALADLQKGQTLLELGCGDGKVVIAAAEKGIKVIGYELNPLLAAVAWLRTRRFGNQVKIVWGDFWKKDWPPAEGIFVFLLPRFMPKLNKKIMQYPYKPVKLVSFAFTIAGREPDDYKDGIYLYYYD